MASISPISEYSSSLKRNGIELSYGTTHYLKIKKYGKTSTRVRYLIDNFISISEMVMN